MESVTAAVPAYNTEAYLRDALKSIFSQTYACAECLVIDDGSTDATPEIASSFPDVRYVPQNNVGVAAARNRAIEEAAGDFIAFLDADDVWLPEKLEMQMALFAANRSLGLVYSGVHMVDASLRSMRVLKAAPGHVALRNTLLIEKPYMTGIGSTAVLPIEVARKVRFDERLQPSADWAFACKVATEFPVDGVEDPLVLYRQHDDAQMHRDLSSIERDMHLVWNELFSGDSLPPELRKYRRRAAANLDLSLAYAYYWQGDKGRGFKHLGRAFARRPDRVVAAFWRRYMG